MFRFKIYILFFLINTVGFSQQSITTNQYYLFDYFYNPSLAGEELYNPLYINYIDQWVGFENSQKRSLLDLSSLRFPMMDLVFYILKTTKVDLLKKIN